MRRQVLLLLCAVFLIGCSDGSVSVVRTAESVDTLVLQTVKLSEELLMPTKMIASCGKVVVYQRKGDDVFVLVDITDGGKCQVIGKKGRGPDEFIGVDVQSIQPIDDGFICMDAGGKIRKVFLGDMVKTTTARTSTYGHPQNGVFTGNRFIAANVMDLQSEYLAYSEDSGKPQPLSEYPDWTGDAGQAMPFVYMKNMAAHPTEGMFASFYVYFRKLRILDSDGNLQHDIDVQLPDEFPTYSSDSERQYFAYASYPCATEKYIYALCFNADKKSLSTSIPEIQVWDWSGNLKRRFILDRHIDIFAVDEVRGIVYGMDIKNADVLYCQCLEI